MGMPISFVDMTRAKSITMFEKTIARNSLNQILAAREKGDTETLNNKMRELRRAELVVDALFKLEEES